MNRYTLMLLLISISLLFCSCTQVRSWEKGNLAKQHMRFDPDPLETRFIRHVEESREGSRGGYGVSGGGCGCG